MMAVRRKMIASGEVRCYEDGETRGGKARKQREIGHQFKIHSTYILCHSALYEKCMN